MYIISYASDFSGLTVGRQYVRTELDEAIACAVTMAQAYGAEEPEAEIRTELIEDLDYVSPTGDWGIFIGQPEEGDPPPPRAKKKARRV